MTETQWAHANTRLKRAELSRMIEPGDLLGRLLITELGVDQAHHLVTEGGKVSVQLQQSIGEAAESEGLSTKQRHLPDALQRWRTRLSQVNGPRDLGVMDRLGGGFIIPEDSCWPQQLDDLQTAVPLGLWFRCAATSPEHASRSAAYADMAQRLPQFGRSIGMVGSREMTDYGSRTASQIAEDLASHNVTVISGGAYGIDAAAHRGALRVAQQNRSATATLAVLAGGLDRFYPAGNEQLLQVVAAQGLLLGEMPPGSSPTKHRFLHRNRLIAALSSVTVVVEARWRSGALSTANHALALGRPVGVIPGSVYSPSSAGCHRLLQESPTELVTDAADIVQLAAGHLAPILTGAGERTPEQASPSLSDLDQRLLDALPARKLTSPGKLSQVAGLTVPDVLTGLTRLQRARLAYRTNGLWGRQISKPQTP